MQAKAKCKVIIEKRIDPFESMQRDVEILEEANKESTAIIRFYNFRPSAIVLGNRQSDKHLNYNKIDHDMVKVVTRRTGGGTLFVNDKDFVFSLAIGKDCFNGVQKGVKVYCAINSIMMNALGHLGVTSDKSTDDVLLPEKHPECFATLHKCELIDQNERKIMGSDFTGTTERGYFQQAYIPLSDSYRRLQDYTNTNVKRVIPSMGIDSNFNELTQAFVDALFGEYPQWRVS